jgi:two-component sensor histidine kinase
VRNILNLIRALVTQSRAGSETLEDFASVIGGRIQALARAHDQITARSWGPSSLHELIRLEAAAYLGVKAGRVEIVGDDVLLEPQAFSTLALVFHEMMTNSAKYGAFADSHGTITITLDRYPQGSLVIDWQESGGPPVKAPTRRGFGTTIIERSIPYELKGEAEIQYLLMGVKATFVIPGHFFSVSKSKPLTAVAMARAVSEEDRPLFGKVLLVEDNLIIALESEDMLTRLGATSVETASSVRDALRLIQIKAPDFAVLDMNLGNETSLPVATCLLKLGVPFVFATGYGEDLGIPADMVDVPILKKPFDLPTLRAIVFPLVDKQPFPDAA